MLSRFAKFIADRSKADPVFLRQLFRPKLAEVWGNGARADSPDHAHDGPSLLLQFKT